jgi:hypothetical protein
MTLAVKFWIVMGGIEIAMIVAGHFIGVLPDNVNRSEWCAGSSPPLWGSSPEDRELSAALLVHPMTATTNSCGGGGVTSSDTLFVYLRDAPQDFFMSHRLSR